MTALSRLRGSKGYEAYDDEIKEVLEDGKQRNKHKSEIIR